MTTKSLSNPAINKSKNLLFELSDNGVSMLEEAEIISKLREKAYLPKVSVVVPIYNGEADLPDLISCLCLQTYPRNLVEYFLVDNRSQDRTAEIIRATAQEVKFQGITIHYLSENKIQSSYASRNTGIRNSSGEILAFTDVDCRPQPDWLFYLVQPFAEPTVGLVGGGITSFKGDTLIEKYSERRQLLSNKGKSKHPFYPFAQTANLAVRRNAFVKVGLFRSHLTTGGDADICWRIQMQTSWQFYCEENAIVEHRHRSTLAELISQFRRYGRSEEYLSELYGIDLRKNWNLKNYLYQWRLWLFKEMPRNAKKMILGKATLLDLTTTPIKLIADWARESGRRKARLLEEARKVDRL